MELHESPLNKAAILGGRARRSKRSSRTIIRSRGDGTSDVLASTDMSFRVDDADVDLVRSIFWTGTRNKAGQTSFQGWHRGRIVRLAATLCPQWADTIIDHINGDQTDNRRCNLRPATASDNARNMRAQKKPMKSKFKGVCSIRRDDLFRAYIYLNGRQQHLGVFSSEEAAARAYANAARLHFAEFACVNFPLPGEQSAHSRGGI